MNDRQGPGEGQGEPQDDPTGSGEGVQQVRLTGVGARVPEKVGRGSFSTGAIVMTGASEFVLDFVQRMGRPHHVVARVVLPHTALPQLVKALEQAMARYEQSFGKPPALPKPDANAQRQSVQDLYEDLKLSDDMLSGTYANGVLIGHSAAEFSFDFITNFFPHSAVSRRVFLSAPHVPPLLESLQNSLKQLQHRIANQRQQQPPPQQQQQQQPLPPTASPYYQPPEASGPTNSTPPPPPPPPEPPDAPPPSDPAPPQ